MIILDVIQGIFITISVLFTMIIVISVIGDAKECMFDGYNLPEHDKQLYKMLGFLYLGFLFGLGCML